MVDGVLRFSSHVLRRCVKTGYCLYGSWCSAVKSGRSEDCTLLLLSFFHYWTLPVISISQNGSVLVLE